jgi:hypothetical protein
MHCRGIASGDAPLLHISEFPRGLEPMCTDFPRSCLRDVLGKVALDLENLLCMLKLYTK